MAPRLQYRAAPRGSRPGRPCRPLRHQPKALPPVIAPFDYAADDQLRRVPNAGSHISFKGRPWRVPKAFKGKIVAVRTTHTDGLYDVVFRTSHIATIDLRA